MGKQTANIEAPVLYIKEIFASISLYPQSINMCAIEANYYIRTKGTIWFWESMITVAASISHTLHKEPTI